MHDKVDVKLGNRSYSIHIGTDLLKSAGDFILPLLRRKKVAIITDSNIAALHLNDLKQSLLSYDIDISVLTLPLVRERSHGNILKKRLSGFLLNISKEMI